MSGPGPALDEGLQPERTLLAWRRTLLAVVVACAALVRLGAPTLGAPAVVAGVLGVALCAAALVGASLRYRQVARGLGSTGALLSPGAAVLAVTTSLLVVGVVGLTLVLGA